MSLEIGKEWAISILDTERKLQGKGGAIVSTHQQLLRAILTKWPSLCEEYSEVLLDYNAYLRIATKDVGYGGYGTPILSTAKEVWAAGKYRYYDIPEKFGRPSITLLQYGFVRCCHLEDSRILSCFPPGVSTEFQNTLVDLNTKWYSKRRRHPVSREALVAKCVRMEDWWHDQIYAGNMTYDPLSMTWQYTPESCANIVDKCNDCGTLGSRQLSSVIYQLGGVHKWSCYTCDKRTDWTIVEVTSIKD